MNKQTCPSCEGRKQTFRFINRGHKKSCENGYYPCEFCNATGEVEPEKLELLKLGKQLRAVRMERRIMARVCAYNFGLAFPLTWFDLENGRATKEDVLKALDWIKTAEIQTGYVSEFALR